MGPNDVRVGQGAWHKPFLLHSHAGSAARIPSSGNQYGGPEPTLEKCQRDPVGPGTAPGNEKCHTQGRAVRSKRKRVASKTTRGGSLHGAFLPVSCAPASGAHWRQLRFLQGGVLNRREQTEAAEQRHRTHASQPLLHRGEERMPRWHKDSAGDHRVRVSSRSALNRLAPSPRPVKVVLMAYSRSGSSGSRKRRACRGLSPPATWRPIATPYGVGLKAGSDPTISTGRR